MTRGTLFYYESPSKVWTSCEYNGGMYHGTKEEPEGIGSEVIELMKNLRNLEDFKEVLKKINKNYQYKEGNECWSINAKEIKKVMNDTIKWIDNERPDLKGNDSFDPRAWEKNPTFRDVRTWRFWGTPNLSDYSYIYNNSGKDLVMTTRDNKKYVIEDQELGILYYGKKEEE